MVERYGTLNLLDEKGEQLDYAEMEYEFSQSPWATEHWHDNGCWACTCLDCSHGLKTSVLQLIREKSFE